MNPTSLKKYRPFPPVSLPDRTWPDQILTSAPEWCSVDLRDGNQALPQPMSVEETLEFFDLLVRVGFKQIEVGFPSAAETEFNFLRRLIDENRIPEDVTIQVLVQTREHLIRRTFEAIDGAKRAIVHIYNSTSPLQRRVTFGDASRDSIKQVAVEGAKLVKQLVPTIPRTDSEDSLSRAMVQYWASFARAGRPVAAGQATWRPSSPAPRRRGTRCRCAPPPRGAAY